MQAIKQYATDLSDKIFSFPEIPGIEGQTQKVALRCLASAALFGLSAALFSCVCPPLAIALGSVAIWLAWSAGLALLDRSATNGPFDKVVHWLHTTTIAINSKIACLALFPVTFSSSYLAPRGNLNGQPILLIHGHLSYASSWHYQRQKLAEAGLGPIYVINLGSCFSSLTEYAEQVQQKVLEIQKETNRNDIALVGHSRGGLVASYYATHLAIQDNIKISELITIGSPLHGTSLAKLSFGKDATQMLPNSTFLTELREELPKHTEFRLHSIASRSDAIVPFPSSLLTEEQSDSCILEDTGHIPLLFSPKVAEQLAIWLKL